MIPALLISTALIVFTVKRLFAADPDGGLARWTMVQVTALGAIVGLEMLGVAWSLPAPVAALPALLVLAIVTRWLSTARRSWPFILDPGSPLSTPTTAILLLSLCVSLSVGYSTLGRPPWDVDSREYHAPQIEEWMSGAPLFKRPADRSRSFHAFLPKNGELAMLWFAQPFGHVRYTAIVNFVALGIAITGLTLAGRSFGASRNAAFFSAGLFGSNVVLHGGLGQQLGTQAVDLFGACVVPLQLFLLARLYRGRGSLRDVFLTSLAVGLATGTKWYQLAYQLPLLAALIAYVLLHDRRLLVFVAAILPAMTLGAIWYAWSWFVFGNPFYPSEFQIFGWVVFPGKVLLTGCTADTLAWNPNCSILGQHLGLLGQGRWTEAGEAFVAFLAARLRFADGAVLLVAMVLCVVLAFSKQGRLKLLPIPVVASAVAALVISVWLPETTGTYLQLNQRFALPSIALTHVLLALAFTAWGPDRTVLICEWVLTCWSVLLFVTSGQAVLYVSRMVAAGAWVIVVGAVPRLHTRARLCVHV